jgi:16S rRNA (cytidine1402-2'-O)-methyltransferase
MTIKPPSSSCACRSTLAGARDEFTLRRQPRGEIVLVIQGAADSDYAYTAALPDDTSAAGSSSSSKSDEASSSSTSSTSASGAAAGGACLTPSALRDVLLQLMVEQGMSVSGAVKEVVANLGANKKAAYAMALELHKTAVAQGTLPEKQQQQKKEAP